MVYVVKLPCALKVDRGGRADVTTVSSNSECHGKRRKTDAGAGTQHSNNAADVDSLKLTVNSRIKGWLIRSINAVGFIKHPRRNEPCFFLQANS